MSASRVRQHRRRSLSPHFDGNRKSNGFLDSTVTNDTTPRKHFSPKSQRWPEDRPCRTEAGIDACSQRSATVIQLFSRQQIRKQRLRRCTQVRSDNSGSPHNDILKVNSSRRLNLLDWGILKHHRRRKHFEHNPYSGLDEGSDGVDSIHSSSGGSNTPAQSPTTAPEWTIEWEWLDGFKGANGPIFR